MTAKIVVIDDDPDFVGYVREVLVHSGYRITGVCSPLAALRVVADADPDLVILDIMMPHVDGWEICRRLRAISDVPILMFTGLGGSSHAAQGLQLGADDYLDKSCCIEELRARVEALLRRSKRSSPSKGPTHIIVDDELRLDLGKRAAIVQGRVVRLTPTEFRLPACLAERPGHLRTYAELWCEVWNYQGLTDKGLIQRTVSNLARKVGRDKIRCIREQGYYLVWDEVG